MENDFHWLFTTVVYQQIVNSERANQIHRFTIDYCKFMLITYRVCVKICELSRNKKNNKIKNHVVDKVKTL